MCYLPAHLSTPIDPLVYPSQQDLPQQPAVPLHPSLLPDSTLPRHSIHDIPASSVPYTEPVVQLLEELACLRVGPDLDELDPELVERVVVRVEPTGGGDDDRLGVVGRCAEEGVVGGSVGQLE